MKPEWKVVAKRDIKYKSMTLSSLLEWVEQNVPTGTNEEDIRLDLDTEEYSGYYDDTIIESTMKLSVRQP